MFESFALDQDNNVSLETHLHKQRADLPIDMICAHDALRNTSIYDMDHEKLTRIGISTIHP